jgi:hypothetical protein
MVKTGWQGANVFDLFYVVCIKGTRKISNTNFDFPCCGEKIILILFKNLLILIKMVKNGQTKIALSARGEIFL